MFELKTGYIDGKEIFSDIPKSYALAQNYPNPFNHDTKIRIELPSLSRVSLIIYDNQGRKIKTVTDGLWERGTHTLMWDGRDDSGTQVSSGLYFILFQGDAFQFVKKAILMR